MHEILQLFRIFSQLFLLAGYNMFVKEKVEEFKGKGVSPPEGTSYLQLAGGWVP